MTEERESSLIEVSSVRYQSMADGALRLTLDVAKISQNVDAIKLFGQPGATGVLARLTPKAAAESARNDVINSGKGPHGKYQQELHKSGFYYARPVHEAIGTDAEYLDWLRTKKCINCKAEAPSEAAHVRRIEHGAGIGIKPPYSAIPLCHTCHAKQHQHGESVIGGKDQFDKWRAACLVAWCKDELRTLMLVDSMTHVSPENMRDWANINQIQHLLPPQA